MLVILKALYIYFFIAFCVLYPLPLNFAQSAVNQKKIVVISYQNESPLRGFAI